MKNIRSIAGIKGILGWCVAGLLSLVIASAFVMIYNFSGTHITNPSGATDYKWSANQYKGNMTEGINWMRMDANGFNNLSADTKDIDILLMGGSHMEAVQFPTERNAGSLLNLLQPDYKTYNIGMSGHQLDTCLDNLEAAVDEFEPSQWLVVHSGDISMTAEKLRSVADGLLAEIPSYDSGIVYHLQKIPAIKVIYKQLMEKISNDRLRSGASAAEVSEMPDYTEEKALLIQVLAEKAAYCAERNIQLVIAYTPPTAVGTTGEMVRTDDVLWIRAFEEVCQTTGVVFIDCFDALKECYDASYEVPYGFNNATMGAGHLNEVGHRVLAEQISEMIGGAQ